MKRLSMLVMVMLTLVAPAMAAQHLRLDVAGVGATDGPSPGIAAGFDIKIDDSWFWGIRASRLSEDEATAHSLTAGLEYGFPNAAGTFAPYLGYRVGGRWSEEDVEVCRWHRCSVVEVDSTGFLYQAVLGIDFMAANSHWGTTAEAAFTDSTDADNSVEFLVGVTFRP